MYELTKEENTYIIMCLVFSTLITITLITYKINFKKASIISIIFAHLFLIILINQLFIINLDQMIGFIYIKNNNERNLDIDLFFEYEYKIVGYVGTFFSIIILPIYEDYLLSGYFSFHQKLWDATKRRLKKARIIAIILLIYIIIGLILYIIKGEDGYIIAKEFFFFVLNCLTIPNFLKAIWYMGAHFPLFFNESKMYHLYYSKRESYYKRLCGVIVYYLNKDKDKIVEAIIDLKYILAKYFVDNTEIKKKKYILHLLEICENEKEQLEINEYHMEKEDLEIKINLENFHHVMAEAIRNIKKGLNQIPRKIFVLKNIEKKFNYKMNKCALSLVALSHPIPIFFAILVGFIAIVNSYYISYHSYLIDKIHLEMPTHDDYFYNLFYKFFIFFILYFSAIKLNSLTEQNIYGNKMSDTICLLEFAKNISGLITPLSVITLDKNTLNIAYGKKNIIFLRNFGIPLVENYFINVKFQDVYFIYTIIKVIIFIISFILTWIKHSLTFKICGKEFKFKINDKNDKFYKGEYFKYYLDRNDPMIN